MNKLAEIIRAEIAAAGVVPFARFMELALYCPLLGYYEKEKDTVGRRGDFYTSVSVGSLFGEMLAFQFAEWLEPEVRSRKSEVRIVEAGAHDGKLAADILNWLRRQRPEYFERVVYWIIEPSVSRREWQQHTLQEFRSSMRWAASLEELGANSNGQSLTVIFSNEYLDALPVHRLGWDATQRQWFEWGVAFSKDRFEWERMPVHDPRFTIDAAPGVLDVLPDGFTTEHCPAAEDWWQRAAIALGRGRLMTIDYGLTADAFLAPERCDGTVRAYHRHRVANDLLANPGEQDLTTHVNFTRLANVGNAAGLKTECLVTQEQFLVSIAERIWQRPGMFGDWADSHTRQFKTLTHPQHLGRPFRVLIQSRFVPATD